MNRLFVCLCVMAILATGCDGRGNKSAPGGKKASGGPSISDRTRPKYNEWLQRTVLLGPVRSVKTERRFVRKSGEWTEAPTTTKHYRHDGRLREGVTHNPDGSVESRTVYAYTADGNMAGSTESDGDGAVLGKVVYR